MASFPAPAIGDPELNTNPPHANCMHNHWATTLLQTHLLCLYRQCPDLRHKCALKMACKLKHCNSESFFPHEPNVQVRNWALNRVRYVTTAILVAIPSSSDLGIFISIGMVPRSKALNALGPGYVEEPSLLLPSYPCAVSWRGGSTSQQSWPLNYGAVYFFVEASSLVSLEAVSAGLSTMFATRGVLLFGGFFCFKFGGLCVSLVLCILYVSHDLATIRQGY